MTGDGSPTAAHVRRTSVLTRAAVSRGSATIFGATETSRLYWWIIDDLTISPVLSTKLYVQPMFLMLCGFSRSATLQRDFESEIYVQASPSVHHKPLPRENKCRQDHTGFTIGSPGTLVFLTQTFIPKVPGELPLLTLQTNWGWAKRRQNRDL